MSKKLFAVALLLSFVALVFAADADPNVVGGKALPTSDLGTTPAEGGGVSWFSAPKAVPNGWYWMYDDGEAGPPFVSPTIPALLGWTDITASGSELAPFNDKTYKRAVPDSFWYYGKWYDTDDYLYISPDGWISFDPNSEPGFPDPPTVSPPFPVADVPNAVIAPLWQDMNPLQAQSGTTDNRVYHYFEGMPPRLYVQWYDLQGNTTTHTYDFEAILEFGGQTLLIVEGECGVVFSYHFINFVYNDQSDGWDADNGKTGIESETGLEGIYYEGTVVNGRRIRAGYKRIFQHDVKVTRFLAPGQTVLRWTDLEPKVEVANVGQEVEGFAVILRIYDESNDDSLVYDVTSPSFYLSPGELDTLVGPCWRPGELTTPDTHYYRKVAFTRLDYDNCFHNDTVTEYSIVHCDGWLNIYNWNWADFPNAYAYRVYRAGTSYDIKGGTYVLGGRVWLGWRGDPPMYSDVPPRLEVWAANSGCGAVPNGSARLGYANYPGFAEPRMWHEVAFDQAVWCPAADPGNFWIAAANSTDPGASVFMGWVAIVGIDPPPDPSSCVPLPNTRSAYWEAEYGDASTGFSWGCLGGYTSHSWPIEALTHLGFSPKPGPPCYFDKAHDLTCYEMRQPVEDYVEDGVDITPELAIANIGLRAEPDPGDFFDVKFIVVDVETGDTVFNKTSLVSSTLDMGDTIVGSTSPWTPEGVCNATAPFVEYELIGLVCLGEVGPDLTDHCPYNDTIRRNVTCLLTHDVGVTDIALSPGPDVEPDHYDSGSVITITATVENFGYNQEHDIPVRCEIIDNPPDTLVYNNIQLIAALDWRGNPYENPYTTDITFPVWTTPSENRFDIECRTEMPGDLCPDDDFEVTSINTGIEETPAGLPFALEAITPNPFVSSTTISYALPHTTNVSLKVYDIAGKLVTTLVNGNRTPGSHSVVWNGTDDAGRSVAQGIYLVRMNAENFSAMKKVVVY
jgi:hypothetical protein